MKYLTEACLKNLSMASEPGESDFCQLLCCIIVTCKKPCL